LQRSSTANYRPARPTGAHRPTPVAPLERLHDVGVVTWSCTYTASWPSFQHTTDGGLPPGRIRFPVREINSAELVLHVDVARGDVDDGAVSLDWSRGPPHCAPTRATNWSYGVLRAKSTRRRWTSRRSCTPTEPDCGGRGDATDPDARRGPGCKFLDRVQQDTFSGQTGARSGADGPRDGRG